MRLHAKETQIAMHRALGQAGFISKIPSRPMRLALGLSLQRRVDELRYLFLADVARPAGLEFVVKSCDAALAKARAPHRHRRAAHAKAPR